MKLAKLQIDPEKENRFKQALINSNINDLQSHKFYQLIDAFAWDQEFQLWLK